MFSIGDKIVCIKQVPLCEWIVFDFPDGCLKIGSIYCVRDTARCSDDENLFAVRIVGTRIIRTTIGMEGWFWEGLFRKIEQKPYSQEKKISQELVK